MKVNVEIARKDKAWQHYKVTKNSIRAVAENILNRFDNLRQVKEFELSILLAGDKEMEELNSRFRKQKKATNVLSFPDLELNWRHLLEFKPNLNYMYLGDIAFSYQTIEKEALTYNISFDYHFTFLLIHGILHLIGYDHKSDEESKVMENLEVDILESFSIPSPY